MHIELHTGGSLPQLQLAAGKTGEKKRKVGMEREVLGDNFTESIVEESWRHDAKQDRLLSIPEKSHYFPAIFDAKWEFIVSF